MTTPTATLSLSTLFRKARRISPQPVRTLLAASIALLALLLAVIPAAATDQVIINGNGCTVQVYNRTAVGACGALAFTLQAQVKCLNIP